MLTTKEIRKRAREIDDYLIKLYKLEKEERKRDRRTEEEKLKKRIEEMAENFRPLVHEAVKNIQVRRRRGRPPTLTLEEKVLILLLKELFRLSNRVMAYMLSFFSFISGKKISYKMVERLYSDPLVGVALQNLHTLILAKKEVKDARCAGDGTGYALTVEKHYRSVVAKRKKEAKEQVVSKRKKHAFTYWFSIIDIDTKLYIAHGNSQKSEKEAFENAMKHLQKVKVKIESIRLDKYFSTPTYVDRFSDTKVYVIPKKNSTVRGGKKWRETMREFVNSPLQFLKEYFLRNHCEAGFSADKRMFGWMILQKKEERINTALTCRALWHNLLNLYPL